jgi:aldose 1-epimerase
MALQALHNDYWDAGILPDTGASIAYGRVHAGGQTRDVLRPTAEADTGNASKTSSFIMLPWCNRIKDGLLIFDGQQYQLRTEKDDGTARHGDVRKRAWSVVRADEQHVIMRLDSTRYADINWPFRFTAEAEYRLDGPDFIWRLSLRNDDTRAMPGGFGYHPYFVREPQAVEIPCDSMFELVDFLAVAPPVPVTPTLDFRAAKPLGTTPYNDLLTGRHGDQPSRLIYDSFEIAMQSDSVFQHQLLFAPEGEPFYALEPMSNASDGINLYNAGVAESGVFVLAPGEAKSAEVRLTVKS